MKPRFVLLATFIVMLGACGGEPAPVEQTFIEEVAAAMGGKEAIVATDSVTIEAEGRMFNLGQDMTPESVTLEFDISGYRLAADLDNGRSRTELTRTPLFDYFRGRDPMRLVFGIDGDIAYDIDSDGNPRRAHDSIAAERRSTFYHHPLPLVRAVLTEAASIAEPTFEGGLELADVTTASGKTFALAVDATTKLPAYISSTDHHSYLRDAVRKTSFSQYQAVGQLSLPSTISQSLDEFDLYRLSTTDQSLNSTSEDLAAPPAAVAAPAVSGSAPAVVESEQLGDGVWFLTGQSHHSVLIEFSDHLMIVEAPNESRMLATIAAAGELVPDKPVTQLVNTHHHFDHSGGVRTAIANGLTIITQAANEAFYRRMAEQPSTIEPDTLTRNPRAITIDSVGESRTYEDESMTVEIYHVDGNPHSSSILMVYLPAQRLLIEADLYNPGRTTPQLFAPNLLDNIQAYGLEVDRIVPIHGGVVPFEELVAAVQGLRN